MIKTKRRLLYLFLSIISIITLLSYAKAQEIAIEKVRILREAQEYEKSTVAVDAHLKDDILQVIIIARMDGTKPRIYNSIVVGPKLGRLSCESREVLLATVEEEEPFLTKRKDKAFISFTKGEEVKKAKGTLTRELFVFKIPIDRIIKGKKYELWVQIESLQKGGKYKTFKFDLENFSYHFSN
jgi:hypothetical protein